MARGEIENGRIMSLVSFKRQSEERRTHVAVIGNNITQRGVSVFLQVHSQLVSTRGKTGLPHLRGHQNTAEPVLTGGFFVELSRPVRIATRMHCWKPPIVGGRLILWGKEAEHLTDLQKHIIQKPMIEHLSNARLQPIQHIAKSGSAQDGAHEILDTEQALLHKRTPDETDSKAQKRASKRSRGISPHNNLRAQVPSNSNTKWSTSTPRQE